MLSHFLFRPNPLLAVLAALGLSACYASSRSLSGEPWTQGDVFADPSAFAFHTFDECPADAKARSGGWNAGQGVAASI